MSAASEIQSDNTLRRAESRFRSASVAGLSLFRRAWLPSDPQRVLAIVHGFAEHSGRYEHLGAWFAQRGFAVHAYDQQGHGRNPGLRGHVDRFTYFLDDLEAFLDILGREHPGVPVYLLGHSMGGLVVLTCAAERSLDVAAIISSAAALDPGEKLSPARLRMAQLLGRLLPRVTMRAGLDLDGLSRDPEVVRRYLEDPLVFDRLSLALGAGLLSTSRRTAEAGPQIDRPTLVLHGTDDPLCRAAGSEHFHRGIAVAGSALELYPGLRHEIFNEPEHEQIFSDVLAWIVGLESRR